jgi:cytoskeletal protein RodZ
MGKDMKMQDKEFDDLFRSKLDNFEMEPSAKVWQNIDTGLDGKKKKGSLFTLLGIAASIIILISAGILFMPKKATNNSNQHKSDKLAHSQVKPTVVKAENNAPVNVQPTKAEQVADAKVPAKPIERVHHPKKIEAPVAPAKEDNQLIAKTEAVKQEPVKPDEQPILAAVPDQKNEVKNTSTQPVDIQVATKQPEEIKTPAVQTQQPILASTQPPVVKENKAVVKRRGIHNIGDLVNLVVAKVDKRHEKLVVFSDTDDDESTITAFHLGAIKIKRDN